MGSLDRKIRRKKEREEQKAAQKVTQGVQDAVEAMPTVCGECGIKFDKGDKEKINSWSLAVYDDGRVQLACPNCGPTDEERIAAEERRAADTENS